MQKHREEKEAIWNIKNKLVLDKQDKQFQRVPNISETHSFGRAGYLPMHREEEEAIWNIKNKLFLVQNDKQFKRVPEIRETKVPTMETALGCWDGYRADVE